MASLRRICQTLLGLSAFLAFCSLTDGSQMEVMSAPNLLRVGAPEYIFVEIQDIQSMHGEDIHVQIIVKNHPTKEEVLVSKVAVLNRANKFQELVQILIPATNFSKDPNMKQYVYLEAHFPDRLLEKVVLVKFDSASIFIQTDKPLYTPGSKVNFRIMLANMEPVGTGHQFFNHQSEAAVVVAVEVVSPAYTYTVDYVDLRSRIYSGTYSLDKNASPGLWKVVARIQDSPRNSLKMYAAEFEVKAYVLPSFEVELTPESSIYFVDKPDLTVHIQARYLPGESVDGVAIASFGVLLDGQKKSIQRSLQNVPIAGGEGTVRLQREHITQTFGNIQNLVGRSIFVAVTVLPAQSGEMVQAEINGITIDSSLYTISFKEMAKFFKPGMPFNGEIEVHIRQEKTQKPAQNLKVNVDTSHGTQVVVRTGSNGKAKFSINTVARTNTLTITAETDDPTFPHERQASDTMVVPPYISKSNSYIHIDVNTDERKLEANLRISCFNNRRPRIKNDLTYLITSRGQLVKYGRHETTCQEAISMILPITKEMLPSFRIIVYYHINENEVVSDSVEVDVKDSCLGSLRLEQASPAPFYQPPRSFRLNIIGDPGANVGLVAVDKGVLALKNLQLTQKKVWDIVKQHDTGCTRGGGKDSMSVFYDAGLLFESSVSQTPIRRGDTKDSECPAYSRKKRAASSGVNTYLDRDKIFFRSAFPESWLWLDVTLPSCPKTNPNCGTRSLLQNLQHSITTWQIIAISVSRTHGICVADPLEVITRKDFFIDLRLPDTAVLEEQLEIKAILHNNRPEPITVRVDLIETEYVCSSAFNHGKYVQEVRVEAQATRSVPFVIVPMKQKRLLIKVIGAVRGSNLNDAVIKHLQVLPNGVLTKTSKTIILDPTKNGVDGYQEQIINSEIPNKYVVPNTEGLTVVYLTGYTSVPVENAISGNSMGSLFHQPSGSGEQNIIHLSLTVIATMYLDKTHQWENVGFEKRNEALRLIKIGYLNELAYRKGDGSFAVRNKQSSTWMTAFVAKLFAVARYLVSIETRLICDAIRFLILQAQQPDGRFTEVGTILQGGIAGDVYGTDSADSMTAFCLIAMQESQFCSPNIFGLLHNSIGKAVAYLERRLPYLTNPYAAAMTSYALANENKLDRGILFKFASPGSDHWPVPKGHVYTLEATAYALLALVKAKAFEEAKPVVRWLTQQQRVSGGYQSTQATIMVYQAVAEYWARAREVEHELEVSVSFFDRKTPFMYLFSGRNNFTRKSTSSAIDRDITVTAKGKGQVTLIMEKIYYAWPQVQGRDCEKFNLSVELLQVKSSDPAQKTYNLRVNVLYMNAEHDSTMAVLDIGLLPGFTVNPDDLNLLSKRGASVYSLNLSDRSSLIIYLNKVSHITPKEILFRIHQTLRVAVLQPAAVSVYEYHEKRPCVKFYHPERINGQLLRLCTNNQCTCAEGSCLKQKRGNINPEERRNKFREISQAGRTAFVYKVSLEEFIHGLSNDIYAMRVVEVINEGSDVNPTGKLRMFIGLTFCRASLGLERGKTYLIMGTSKDIFKDESYEYILSESSWLESWPTPAECQTIEHRARCLGLDEMAWQLVMFGSLA